MKPIDLAFRAASAAIVVFFLADRAAISQGLQSEQTIDAIVQTPVAEEQATAVADEDKVIAAIEKTPENTEAVRKTSALDGMDIVFLPDAAPAEGGPPPKIEAKIEEHADQIAQLRKEIEGNAMLYHALDSRRVLVRDVLAVDFDGASRVVIYAAAAKVR